MSATLSPSCGLFSLLLAIHRMGRIDILGVPIDAITKEQALVRVRAFLRAGGQYHVTTTNPEMVLEAQSNAPFMEVLASANLSVPDGTGILWAAKRLGTSLPERVTGTDLMIAICEAFDIGGIFLLGAAPGVAERIVNMLHWKQWQLKIVGTHAGSPSPAEEDGIVAKINAAKPCILFVAYGAPAQELWIARNLRRMPSVKVAMGVGGAFDLISGLRQRAPKWMQVMGLEWLYRLVQEPIRFPRIWKATVVFPLVFLRRQGRRRA